MLSFRKIFTETRNFQWDTFFSMKMPLNGRRSGDITVHKSIEWNFVRCTSGVTVSSCQLMTELQDIELDENMRLCSFDIENMYTNIPKGQIIKTVNNNKKQPQNQCKYPTRNNIHLRNSARTKLLPS